VVEELSVGGGAEEGRTPWPPHSELDNRQNAKYLPFLKLQPPKKIKGFYILSHSLPSRIRHVLFFLATYWPLGNGIQKKGLVHQMNSFNRYLNGVRLHKKRGDIVVRNGTKVKDVNLQSHKVVIVRAIVPSMMILLGCCGT